MLVDAASEGFEAAVTYPMPKGRGFSLDDGNPPSINELSPCVPRFWLLDLIAKARGLRSAFVQSAFDLSYEDFASILWTPDNVIFARVDYIVI